jgi:hypothetical protein
MRRNLALLSLFVIALSASTFLSTLPVTHAQSTGTVCIADISSTSCPSAPASFTSPTSQGRQEFAVNIQNSDTFDSFDVSVKVDPFVLTPDTISLTGSLIQDPRQIVRMCINNNSFVGSCRSGIDNYGVVSLAVTALGYAIEAPASGRLFSIAYNPGVFCCEPQFSSTSISYQTGCTETSNNGFCVTIADSATGTAVPENLQEATFSFRDFFLSLSDNFLIITKGTSPTFTVTLFPFGPYEGTISLTARVSPITRHPPSPSVSPTSVTLSPDSTATSTLTVTTTRSTTVGRYQIAVIGTDGVLTRFTSLELIIESR